MVANELPRLTGEDKGVSGEDVCSKTNGRSYQSRLLLVTLSTLDKTLKLSSLEIKAI